MAKEKEAKRELPYTKLERLKYELSLLEHMEGGLSISEARIFMFAKIRRDNDRLKDILDYKTVEPLEEVNA